MKTIKIALALILTIWICKTGYSQQCQEFSIDIVTDISITTQSPTPEDDYMYYNVCQGSIVNFKATGNYYQNNTDYFQSDENTTFMWTIRGGMGFSGPQPGEGFDLEFMEVRGWDIEIYAVDQHGCYSNPFQGRIRVAANPLERIPEVPDICPGDELELCVGFDTTATFKLDSVKAEIASILTVADTLFLPDGSGVHYQSTVLYNIFSPGETLQNISDLIAVRAALNHTYLGDLSIWLECPTHQTVYFLPYTNNGGCTVLGEPTGCLSSGCETCQSSPLTMLCGGCYDYYWSPTATRGRLDESQYRSSPSWFYNSSNNNVRTQSSQLNHVPTDYYQANGGAGAWNALIGCPLNGEWTLHIQDNIGRDNGWICQWSIELNPDLVPGGWDYSVGLDHVSTTEPQLTVDGECFTVFNTTPYENQPFNFAIVDEYQCAWDSIFYITTIDPTIPDLGEDFFFCDGETVQIGPRGVDPTSTFLWNTGEETENITVADHWCATLRIRLRSEFGKPLILRRPHSSLKDVPLCV